MAQNSLGLIETHSYAWALKVLQNSELPVSIKLMKIETPGDGIVSLIMEGDLSSVKKMVDESSAALIDGGQLVSSFIIPKPHDDLIKYLKEK